MTFEGLDGPFWEAAAQQRLVAQVCQSCGAAWWPAVERCGHCARGPLKWTDVPARGRIWSYAVYHRVFDPRLQVSAPYAIAAVELDVGVCLPGRMVGSLDGLAVGATVEASFAQLDGELMGPVWSLTGDEGGGRGEPRG
jgi:uncharacterized OB-fold protein